MTKRKRKMTNEQAYKLAKKKWGRKARAFYSGQMEDSKLIQPYYVGGWINGIGGYGNSWEDAFKDAERDQR